MARNKIKIKSDPENNTLSFYILNEQQKWCPVSNSSALSRKKLINSNIEQTADELLNVINSIYNMRNRGVNIYFEGSDEEFSILKSRVNKCFADKNMQCILERTMIAVAGKIHSGKTTLIQELARFRGDDYVLDEGTEIPTYSRSDDSVTWYEIPGIDIGIENIVAARTKLEHLIQTGLTTFVYCSSTARIELAEEKLINFVVENYPSLKVILVLTQHINIEGNAYSDDLIEHMNGIRVIPVIAQSIKTRNGIIEAYGLDVLNRAIFEGR